MSSEGHNFLEFAIARDKQALVRSLGQCDPASAELFHQVFYYDLWRGHHREKALGIRPWLISVLSEVLPNVPSYARSPIFNVLTNMIFSDPGRWRVQEGAAVLRPYVDPEIRRLVLDDIIDRGLRPANLFPLAYLAHVSRNFEPCERLMQLAVKSSTETGEALRHYEQGAISYIAPVPANFEIAAKRKPDGMVVFERTARCNDNLSIVFCLDHKYFLRYAPNIIGSVDGMGIAIHFHLINPNREQVDFTTKILDKYRQIGYSYETEAQDHKVYYASSRMLRAAQLLEGIGTDIVIHDADIWFSEDPRELYRSFRDYEIALLRRAGARGFMPWRSVGAQAMYFRYSSVGREAAAILSSIMAHHLSKISGAHEDWWWIDQNALNFFWEFLLHRKIKVGEIPGQLLKSIHHSIEYKQELKVKSTISEQTGDESRI